MTDTCSHLDQVDAGAVPSAEGCEDCLRTGGRWVHLRMCRMCGHVGCCDDSPSKHATAHHASTGHQLISSYEPGEDWWWCFEDQLDFTVSDLPDFSHP
jgi:Zn-finger in ubiquitin-hydrolases and other protein